ncbi:unnamed protein product [Hydatigera taeniaeformis]|uniref:DUF3707 domain-containing protein n=1 Tax=Hydatigena taeniaeformis TaxID=6205 RepID=A0A0R3XAY8_HYDTA|nr:unnamed protein product [Hydatigera taeniaeformis]
MGRPQTTEFSATRHHRIWRDLRYRAGLRCVLASYVRSNYSSQFRIDLHECFGSSSFSALEMQPAFSYICILVFLLIRRSNGDCVMFGMCNDKQYCFVNQPPVFVPGDSLKKICGVDSLVQCCDQAQLRVLEDKFSMLDFVLKSHFATDQLSSVLFLQESDPVLCKVIKVGAFNRDIVLSRIVIDDFLFGRAVDIISNVDDCDMENFYRSFNLTESSRGRSPYAINFVFIDDYAVDNSTTPVPSLVSLNETAKPTIRG